MSFSVESTNPPPPYEARKRQGKHFGRSNRVKIDDDCHVSAEFSKVSHEETHMYLTARKLSNT